MTQTQLDALWQDSKVRFDVSNKDLLYRPGELLMSKLDHVEDSKGNSGGEAYDSSRLFRDMRLRSHLIEQDKLILLPGETVYEEMDGVWNLSSDTMSIRIRNSKFGKALAVETSKQMENGAPTPDEELEEDFDENVVHEDQKTTYMVKNVQSNLESLPVYNKFLGLAVEPLPKGCTVEDLWNITADDTLAINV